MKQNNKLIYNSTPTILKSFLDRGAFASPLTSKHMLMCLPNNCYTQYQYNEYLRLSILSPELWK